MLIRIILIFLSILFLTCSEEKKNHDKELFTLKILLDNFSKPPEPVLSCQDTMKAMELCAANAPEFSTFPLTEDFFVSMLSEKKYTNYEEYCSNLVKSDMYKNQSDSLKECNFKCTTSYWQTRKNLNICNDSLVTMSSGMKDDSGTISCFRNCIMWINNNP